MAEQDTHDLKNQQLLSAYLDGELGVADRALAENLIRDNPHYAQLVEQWRESGIDLRALPKYRLDDKFTDRVLDQVIEQNENGEQVVAQSAISSRQAGDVAGSPLSIGSRSSEQASSRLAMVSIGVLAASLLATLLAFPALIDSSPEGAPSAANVSQPVSPSNTDAAETEVPRDELKSDSDLASELETNDQPAARSHGPIQRVPRGMGLANKKQIEGGAVAALAVSDLKQNVEQILYVELGSELEQFDIEEVLSQRSIKTVGNEGASSEGASSQENPSSVEAIYAVATLSQMQRAAEQLAEEFSAKVTIVPVPVAAMNVGSATRLESRSFDSDSNDPEVAELDQWFGLSASGDESRPVRFLILLKR